MENGSFDSQTRVTSDQKRQISDGEIKGTACWMLYFRSP